MARSRRGATRPATAPAQAAPVWPQAALLFACAAALRLLYVFATPDAGWPASAAFKGDARLWLDYARALQSGGSFDLGLPIHPPGNAYLIAALWDGRETSLRGLRALWCVLGALPVALLYPALREACGAGVALVAGVVMACATGPLLLASSLNNETPYAVLVALGVLLGLRVARRPTHATLLAWGGLQALACLMRVEHALVAALWSAWLVRRWRAAETPASARLVGSRLALVAVAALLALAPWHARAWRAVARFNAETPALTFAEQAARARLVARYGVVSWSPAAAARRAALPAFARDTAALFVAASVAQRGRDQVQADDFALLEQAFGSIPRPLSAYPFVSLYGPLNFALANNAAAEGGFSTALLERSPPARERPGAFPAELVNGLPPPQLAFPYPPHLALVNDGYALGLTWIATHPVDFTRLAARKLARYWAGAAQGFGGFNVPLGASGLRPAVDVVVPEPGLATFAWQALVAVLALAGARVAWRRPSLQPLLLWVAGSLVVTLAFFGYARQGALVAPVVALLGVLAFEAPLARLGARAVRLALGLALALLALEGARALHPPVVRLDGRTIAAGDPLPADHHQPVRYEAR